MDREKVIKGFTVCSEHGLLNGEDCHGHYEYTDNLADIIKANDYSKQCPYNGCKTGCVKTLAKDTLALLKEQNGLMLALDQSNAANGYLNAEVERLNVLLKEQEAVEPKYNARTNWYECGNCHYSMTSGMHCRSELIPATKVRYCANCGFPVNWEGR